MEKIYMENNNGKKQNKVTEILNAKLPHHLSALMIMLAFVSFMAIRFSGPHISYALTQEELGDSFTTKAYAAVGNGEVIRGNVSIGETITINGEEVPFTIRRVYTESGIQLFCLDRYQAFPSAVNFTKGNQITDAGLIYILSNTYPKVQIRDVSTGEALAEPLQTWITQLAVWNYTGSISDSDIVNYKLDQDTSVDVDSMNNETYYDSSHNKIYATYVKPILDAAKTASGSSIKVTKASGDITVTSDNKYYKSPVITVSGISEGTVYSVKLNNAPEGSKLYKTDGTEIKDLNNVNTNNFYMLVPIDKVTEKTKSVTLSVTGPGSTAYTYDPASTGYQRVTALVDQQVSTGLDLVYEPNVPDTGMSTTQSIYFIGLVILLCGIGIIYANAKPRES